MTGANDRASSNDAYTAMNEDFDRILAKRPTSIAEYGEQPALGEYRNNLRFEKGIYDETSKRAANYLIEHPYIAGSLRVFVVRCPERGCFLADIFKLPLKPYGDRLLAMTNLVRGNSRSGWLNWAFSDDSRGMPVYLPSGCRHGSARLGTGWLEHCAVLMLGWKHQLQTDDEFFESFPVELQRSKRSSVFKPPAEAWRAKRRG